MSTGDVSSNEIQQLTTSNTSSLPSKIIHESLERELSENMSLLGPVETATSTLSDNDSREFIVHGEHLKSSFETTTYENPNSDEQDPPNNAISDGERIKELAKLIAKRYLWRGIAVGSLIMGFGFIFLARHLQNDMRTQRKWRR